MLYHAGAGRGLLGFVGLFDPPRSQIPELIRFLRQTQIRVFMVFKNVENWYSP